jgi:integrase
MARSVLTDRTLKALARRPAAHGKTYDVADGIVPGLAARVMPSGQISFVLLTRFPGARNPTRRSLGSYGALTLDEARTKARAWLGMIKRGIDPGAAEQQTRADNLHRQANTFAVVLEDYIRLAVVGPDLKKPLQRRGREVARDLRRTFVPLWGVRPVTDITRRDVLLVIEGVRDVGTEQTVSQGLERSDAGTVGNRRKARGTPAQARNALSSLKTLFGWAIYRGVYGIETSPCAEMRAERIVGGAKKRGRILSDNELRAFWRATGRMGYPIGPLYRLLLLSGLRLNEAADASPHELDYSRAAWTIPADRMKGKNATARPHVVPLTKDILELFESLPQFEDAQFVFSTTFGVSPVWVSSQVKSRLDRRMLRTLQAVARRRGEDPCKVELPGWVNHDLRRTLRTGLSALRINGARVDRDVREAVLAHAKPGLDGVYDLYDLFDEKRDALEAWAARLRNLVEPPAKNVVPFPSRTGTSDQIV